MTEPPVPDERDRKRAFRDRNCAAQRFWSWLTDPIVLLYRREALWSPALPRRHGGVLLFVREVTREFYTIEGPIRAAALALHHTALAIPLLVASRNAAALLQNALPELPAPGRRDSQRGHPVSVAGAHYHLARFAETRKQHRIRRDHLHGRRVPPLPGDQERSIRSGGASARDTGRDNGVQHALLRGSGLMAISFTTTNMLEKNKYLRSSSSTTSHSHLRSSCIFVAFTMLFWLVLRRA